MVLEIWSQPLLVLDEMSVFVVWAVVPKETHVNVQKEAEPRPLASLTLQSGQQGEAGWRWLAA